MSETSIISNQPDPFIYTPRNEQETIKKSQVIEALKVANESTEDILATDLEKDVEKILETILEKQNSINSNILDRILRLINTLIPLVQQLAVSQAGKLDLSTNMQAFYTDLIANAPPLKTEKDIENKEEREKANNQIMSNNEIWRAYRDQWSDIAKKDQTLTNTSNEAVNQLIDTLTTTYQLLKELVSMILRK